MTAHSEPQTAQCPRCGDTCPVRSHNHAHCGRCFSGFRIDNPLASLSERDLVRLGHAPRLFEPAPEQMSGQLGMDGLDD